MDINTYQTLAARTINDSLSPEKLHENMIMGLMGETGEVIDILKKIGYHGHTLSSHLEDLEKEMGDIMWYLASLATIKGISLPSTETSSSSSSHLDYFILSTGIFRALHTLITEDSPGALMALLERIRELIGAAGLSMGDILQKNITKLMKRYPDGFSTEDSMGRRD